MVAAYAFAPAHIVASRPAARELSILIIQGFLILQEANSAVFQAQVKGLQSWSYWPNLSKT